MEKVLNIFKPVGATPLETLNKFREKHSEYINSKMAYAGRLDPMASGVLLVLVDEECKNRGAYQDLKKQYSFDMILGVATDTYDILGLVSERKEVKIEDIKKKLEKVIPNFIGEIDQKFPPYSSKPVGGKPLFQWAREGKLDKISIPSVKRVVKSLHLHKTEIIKGDKFTKNIVEKVIKVKGDFRQNETIKRWKEEINPKDKLLKVSFSAEVGTGTYIRSLAVSIGQELDMPALADNIVRTRVGEYSIEDSIRL